MNCLAQPGWEDIAGYGLGYVGAQMRCDSRSHGHPRTLNLRLRQPFITLLICSEGFKTFLWSDVAVPPAKALSIFYVTGGFRDHVCASVQGRQ